MSPGGRPAHRRRAGGRRRLDLQEPIGSFAADSSDRLGELAVAVLLRDAEQLLEDGEVRAEASLLVMAAASHESCVRVSTGRQTPTIGLMADGTVHRERFDIGAGALLWRAGGMAFLLQGAGPKDEATSIAVRIDP
jgi:hypothetical protein